MLRENPAFALEASILIPKWGTTEPVTIWDLIVPILDENGRPLQERARYNIADVPMEYELGSADNGRDHYPVNMSAFRAVESVFPAALGLISHVRETMQPYDKKVTAGVVESTLNTANALPMWAVLCDKPMLSGEVPIDMAAAAKIIRGGMTPYYAHFARDVLRAPKSSIEPVPLTTQDFLKRVFNGGFLIGDFDKDSNPPQRACPAPVRMIGEFAHTLFDTAAPMKDEAGAKLAELGISPVEIQRAREFGTALGKAILLTNRWGREDHGGLNPKQVVGQLNGMQRRINTSLGREEPPPLKLDDI